VSNLTAEDAEERRGRKEESRQREPATKQNHPDRVGAYSLSFYFSCLSSAFLCVLCGEVFFAI